MSGTRRFKFHLAAGLLAAAVLVPPIAGASAQGLFDFLFGGSRHYRQAPRPPWGFGYAPPQEAPFFERGYRSASRSGAYCVRLCDGSHFPIEAGAERTAGELCHSLCPASKTAVFFGGDIEAAAAADGKRYAELDNAFLYRQKLVPGCTCNGKDAFGLARIRLEDDPTMRPGDLVATEHGLLAYTPTRSRDGEARNFTPVEQFSGLPRELRRRLATIRAKRAD